MEEVSEDVALPSNSDVGDGKRANKSTLTAVMDMVARSVKLNKGTVNPWIMTEEKTTNKRMVLKQSGNGFIRKESSRSDGSSMSCP